jgi:hypothetical protein
MIATTTKNVGNLTMTVRINGNMMTVRINGNMMTARTKDVVYLVDGKAITGFYLSKRCKYNMKDSTAIELD